METKRFTQWIENKSSCQRFFLSSVKDDSFNLKIILTNKEDGVFVIISFKEHLLYKITNESYLLKKWKEWNKSETDLGKVFYIDNRSELIKEFNENTFDIYKKWEITHYCIYTVEDCIDVLSISKPIIKWGRIDKLEK